MTRKLFLAPFGAHDATDKLLSAALALGRGPDFRSITYLCPSPRKLRDTEHRFAGLCGFTGFIPPVFATPRQLARSLYEASGTARPLPASLRTLLVRRLLPQDRRTLGYAGAVSDFIAEVNTWVPKSNRPGLRALFEVELAGFDKPLARAREALDTLEAYERELDARGRTDDEGIWHEAARLAPAHPTPARVLLLDGFAAPNPLEQSLLSALISTAGTTFATCFCGADSDPDYALAARFRAFIEQQGRFTTEQLSAPSRPEPVSLTIFPDQESEVAGIARHLRARGLNAVVALPDLDASAPLVRRVFGQYGIPCTLYPEQRLDTSPPVRDALELLRALDSDFERVPTVAALSSHWLPGLLRLSADPDDSGRNRAAAALNTISRRAGIIKGRTNWERLSDRLAASEGKSSESRDAFSADLQARVRQSLGLADKLLEPADTAGRQASRLKAFLEAVGFGRSSEAEELVEDRGSLYDLLDELVAFEQEFGLESEPRSGFVRTLEHLTRLSTRSAEPAPTGVLVVRLTETIGLHPEHVVIGGLTDTNLPGACRTDPILPDRLRRRLGMPDLDWHRDWQRFHLRRTVESSRTTPLLCAHEWHDGRPVLPTPLLELPVQKPPVHGPACAPLEAQLDAGARRSVPFADRLRAVDFSDDKDAIALLGRRFGPERAISVTGIEAYRACAHRFYLERVLGLESRPEPQYEIDAAQWGSVIHAAMQRLYARGPVPLVRLADRARAALDSALREAELPRFWAETARRVFDNLLPSIVAIETELRERGWTPKETEHPVSGAAAPGILVRGRLDRLDSGPEGLRVLDYKTGAGPVGARTVIEDRTHVQLPLYARLIADELRQPVDNAGIYGLRDGRLRWLADTDHPLELLIRAALETTVEVVNGIRAGRFPAEPADERTCQRCDFGFLCRPSLAADD